MTQTYLQDSVEHPLFSAGADSESDGDVEDRRADVDERRPEEGKARDQTRNQRTNGGSHVTEDTRSVIRESMDVERLWDEDHRARTG